MRQGYVLLDLFSGAGGYARGFNDTGLFKPVLAVDSFPPAARTYKANFPSAVTIGDDVKEVNLAIIKELIGLDRG